MKSEKHNIQWLVEEIAKEHDKVIIAKSISLFQQYIINRLQKSNVTNSKINHDKEHEHLLLIREESAPLYWKMHDENYKVEENEQFIKIKL